MRIGKLSSEELKKFIISQTVPKRAEVLVSAGVAEDCSAVSADGAILITTDPITSATANAGRLAIDVSANDIASSGGEPFCCLLTIIAPVIAEVADVAAIMNEAKQYAAKLNIDIIGGHTEFSDAVNRTVVSCCMLGKAGKVYKTADAVAGDQIIMTKTAGIEATAVLAADCAKALLDGGMTAAEMENAQAFINDISVIPDGKAAIECDIHSMHDVTEGGLFGAISELCEASGTGAVVYPEKVAVHPLTEKVCGILNLNVMRLLSSGCMLICAPDGESVVKHLNKKGVPAAVIGRLTEDGAAYAQYTDGRTEKLSVLPDELLSVKRS